MKTLDQETTDLLNDILDYMMDNDLECGNQGSRIYRRILRRLRDAGTPADGDDEDDDCDAWAG